MNQVPVRINKDLYNRLVQLAESEKRSVIKQLEVILEDCLGVSSL